MTPSASNPKLPLWVFLTTDAVLIAAAWFIADSSRKPLSLETSLLIVGCIAAGGLITLVPLIARFERAKNEALDDRQRSLEALARTLTSAAEQISIAANGLNEITALAQRNLKEAEQLPLKLQERITAFQAQLKDTGDTEKTDLRKELAKLRASEVERLDAAAKKIAQSLADFAKLEAATQQHAATANETLARATAATTAALVQAQDNAAQAIARASSAADQALAETVGRVAKVIEQARAAALAEIEASRAAAVAAVGSASPTAAPVLPLSSPPDAGTETPANDPSPSAPAADSPAPVSEGSPKAEPTAQPPRRPRKRREETSPAPEAPAAIVPPDAPAAAPAEVLSETPANPAPAAPEPEPQPAPVAAPVAAEEPAPVEKIPEVVPAAPESADPFPDAARTSEPAASPTPEAVASSTPDAPTAAEPVAPKVPRKRASKKADAPAPETPATAAPASEPELALPLEESAPREPGERTLSSDGATRLIVTAYIGIGNRLFVRGEGPGLSWEKGVPLQFVSIGKWRWETNDATATVRFKLYKNDDLECTALGTQQVEPGYQQELNASF